MHASVNNAFYYSDIVLCVLHVVCLCIGLLSRLLALWGLGDFIAGLLPVCVCVCFVNHSG